MLSDYLEIWQLCYLNLVENENKISRMTDIRGTNHYIVFRIGADTDVKNGRIQLVEKALKSLEAKEDYIACQALYDALQQQNVAAYNYKNCTAEKLSY